MDVFPEIANAPSGPFLTFNDDGEGVRAHVANWERKTWILPFTTIFSLGVRSSPTTRDVLTPTTVDCGRWGEGGVCCPVPHGAGAPMDRNSSRIELGFGLEVYIHGLCTDVALERGQCTAGFVACGGSL